MKQFKTRILVASIATLVSAGVAADTYDYQIIETPESVRDAFAVDINDQGLALMQTRVPFNAELNFDLISARQLADAQISTEFDPETDTLTRLQYFNLINLLGDRVNNDSTSLRLATNFGAEFNGQQVTIPALLNSAGNAASSQLNSSDSEFHGLNQNNIRVGIVTAPYVREDYTYQPEPDSEGNEFDPITTSFAQRDFTSRALWFDGSGYKLIAPPETQILGGESALFDINEQNLAVGFASVSVTPRSATRIEECLELEGEASAPETPYNCVWRAWHAAQQAPAANMGSFAGVLYTNGSIYNVQATTWQLDANGEVLGATHYPPLMERMEEDEDELSTYAYAVNNNGVAVGQSWTYWGDEPEAIGRIKMPAIFIDGETRPVTTDVDYVWGAATDINDDDLAIGFVMQTYQGVRRADPFVFDVAANEFEVLPTFFVGSSTYPNSINNQGFVVGNAEIDPSLNNTRKQAGFIYNLNDPELGLIDLNDAIGCSADVYIVSAEAINENNQVLATAIVDQQYTDENGETQTEQLAKTLILNPISGGEISNCSDTQDKVERQGGSMSPWSLLAMLLIGGLITVRRKF